MDVIKEAFNNCDFENPLEWNDQRRVDLEAGGVRGTDACCIDFLQTHIELSDQPTYQMFTGFRGSGKSTELKMLAKKLRDKNYCVIYVDTETYLNLHVPAQVSDLLISMAAGVDSYLENEVYGAGENQIRRFWDRLYNFLNSEVNLDHVRTGIPNMGELQASLKKNAGFKQALDEALQQQGRISELAQKCLEFFDEALAVINRRNSGCEGVVLIMDSFEKLRGDMRNAQEVRESAEHVFIRDADFLRLPFNVIYTVPPWMAFVEFGASTEFDRPHTLPMCKVHEGNNSREEYEDGIKAMLGLLDKRLQREELFATSRQLRELIKASGGYPRDLLRMVRELLVRMRLRQVPLPASDEDVAPLVSAVIEETANLYDQAITDESLDLLKRIATQQDLHQHSREEIHRLADLFDHHFILSYRNGRQWFDVHPLVRNGRRLQRALDTDAEH